MRNAAFMLFSALFFIACENPSEIGFNLVDDDGSATVYNDSLSIEASTVLLDSAYTSDNNFILAGNAEDPIFGKINATAYLQPNFVTDPNSSTAAKVPFDLDTTANLIVFDSLLVRLVNSGIAFGDTVTKVNFGLYRLKNGLSLSKRYTNFDNTEYETSPILTYSINIDDFKKNGTDTLKVFKLKLPTEIGLELTKLIGTSDNETFVKSFPGFAIAPISGGKCIYGLNMGALNFNTCTLQYFYHVSGETTYKEFDFDFSGPRYTKIEADRSNTILKDLKVPQDEVSAKSTNNLTYLQGSAGLATKLKFSGFTALNKSILVSKAVVTIDVDNSYFNNLYRNPVYFTISKNANTNRQETSSNFVPLYLTPNGKAATGQTGVYTDSTKTLKFDITPYLQDVSLAKEIENGILILPATFYSSSGSLFTNDTPRRAVLKNPKLQLYYRKK